MARRSPMSTFVGPDIPKNHAHLDAKDIELLRELTRDARQSQRSLGRRVGMSPPAVAERLARFERTGVIKSYGATIDWDRLGLDVVVYIPVSLKSGHGIEATIEAFREIPELEELTALTGRYDLLARFRLADQRHLRDLVVDRIWQIPHIQKVETMLSLGTLVDEEFATKILDSCPVEAAAEAEAQIAAS